MEFLANHSAHFNERCEQNFKRKTTTDDATYFTPLRGTLAGLAVPAFGGVSITGWLQIRYVDVTRSPLRNGIECGLLTVANIRENLLDLRSRDVHWLLHDHARRICLRDSA